MKWDEFELQNKIIIAPLKNKPGDWVLTDIECPECGKHIYAEFGIVYFSYPPCNRYKCECGWIGWA